MAEAYKLMWYPIECLDHKTISYGRCLLLARIIFFEGYENPCGPDEAPCTSIKWVKTGSVDRVYTDSKPKGVYRLSDFSSNCENIHSCDCKFCENQRPTHFSPLPIFPEINNAPLDNDYRYLIGEEI